ncbi:MAG: methyltransferase domain-containing protein [Nitrospira sp.]|nr:methyltransferase domain-containing protein [Nitrospira sp.]
MSHVKVVTLPKMGSVSVVCKTKRDLSPATPLDKRDDEALGWLYWDRIWPSSVALSEWLIQQFFPDELAGQRVLEIGCGTGLVGVVAAKLGASTTFSDLVPITLEAVKETCSLNGISHVDTWTLDWTGKVDRPEQFDMVVGSEIFYDSTVLGNIAYVLRQTLAPGGTGFFCDPNRLGLDTIKQVFQERFNVVTTKIPLTWPPRKGYGGKMATLYQFRHRFSNQI